MFKTIKSRMIFVIIFCCVCIMITIGAVIYKNIEINDDLQDEDLEIANNENNIIGINLNGTYNQNDLTITEKKATKDKIEITYCQINGLKDTTIQNNINKEIEATVVGIYKEKIDDLDKVINISAFVNSKANFANVLSLEVGYVAKINDDGDGFYQGYKGLNYDLTTGKKISFDDLFVADAPMQDILRKSTYYSLIQRNTEDNLAGELTVSNYGDVEDDVEVIIDQYQNNRIKEFTFSPKNIYIYYDDAIVNIDMSKYYDYIAIYSRYKTEDSIYDKNDIALKNLYTLSERNTSLYSYTNYQKGSNYFIDINLLNADGKDNAFSEKLKKEKIIELEAEIERIKNLVYKNPDNFYILNYNLYISTTYDNLSMKNITSCETKGNSYEMTVHDFEESIEPIIIKVNRQDMQATIPDYIYDFKDVLSVEIQSIKEYYDPTTGEKIVI
mgnify:CR=1 FL=1